MPTPNTLRIATCQFRETFQPRRNALRIHRYLAAAKKAGADVVHFHEGALSGYGPTINKADYDWAALLETTEELREEARRKKLWVILGSAHPLTPPNKPHNSLYLISPEGQISDRYDKRFLMPADLPVYSPGDHFVTFTINGIRCGLLICFDLRFPELYRELLKLKVQVLFQSFNTGGFDGPGLHGQVLPATLQGHAGINAMWISAANSARPHSRWGSVFITPEGLITARLSPNRSGLMINTLDLRQRFYDPIGQDRFHAAEGALSNSTPIDDLRSRNRQTL